jgi:anti-anti-sigma regulatory factor
MTTSTSVADLSLGDHACLTFSDAEERLDIVAAFVGHGLEQGQKVLCFTDSVPPGTLISELTEREVLPDGVVDPEQLVVGTPAESWLVGGAFHADALLDLLADQVEAAQRDGFTGLRMTADMCWATRPPGGPGQLNGLEQLVTFEKRVNELFVDGQLTAICQYDRHSFDAVTLAIAADSHPRAVAAATYHQDPILRICRQYRPPGVRVAGDLDYTRLAPLATALEETLRLDSRPYLNLRDVHFIDVPAANTIMSAVAGLGAEQTMTIVCPGRIATTLRLLGLTELPRLQLLISDGRR